MTENRHAELYTGLNAFRGSMVQCSGDLAALAEALRRDAKTMRALGHAELAMSLSQEASMAERIAVSLADGLERLTRLADGAMDDTQDMDLGDLSEANLKDT